jgi:hypothetical protein
MTAMEVSPMNRHLWILTTLVLLASCTSQSAALQSAAQFGCKISPEKLQDDAERICEGASSRPITMGGMQADSQRLEQDEPRTMNVSVPITMPNGDVAAEVLCEINTRHHSVTYVRITRGPTTQQQADFLRSQGACDE